jgi:acyl-CoA thioesterase I
MQWFRRSCDLRFWTLWPRTYGRWGAAVQARARFGALPKEANDFPLKMPAKALSGTLAAAMGWMLAGGLIGPTRAADEPVRIVALGDSLTAGFNLAASAAFPPRLERALAAKGHAVKVANAGVSGDTATGGLARLEWSVPDGTDAVILELGANDMLRGIDPKVTHGALDAIMGRLKERRIAVLLAGMRAIPNLGIDYVAGFETIYVDIATKYDPVFYPFFLEGIAGVARFNQRDGLHPTAAGVDAIVTGILPKAEELVARVQATRRK